MAIFSGLADWIQENAALVAAGTLLLNVVVLAIVFWQTLLTRRSAKIAERAFLADRQIRELSDLPKSGYLFPAIMCLRRWRDHMQQLIDERDSLLTRIEQGDHTLAKEHGVQEPAGLVDSYLYEQAPEWLRVLAVTGAQYYYNCTCLLARWSGTGPLISSDLFLTGVIPRAREGATRITEMLTYLEHRLPDWYANSPASLSDRDFLDK